MVDRYLAKYWSKKQSEPWLQPNTRKQISAEIGVRLRPHLFRLSCEAGGFHFRDVLPIAAGLEILQVSTLVIDDYLDESPLRNGLSSLYSLYGAKKATCIGTILLSHAFELISSEVAGNERLKNGALFLQRLSECHADIYSGQLADLDNEANVAITERQFLRVIELTTARFIQTSLVGGAILWNAPRKVIHTLDDIGKALGMAYQVRDDVVDIVGEPEMIGKPVGGDLNRCKMRLPAIYALKRLKGSDREELRAALSEGSGGLEIGRAISLIEDSGAIQKCIGIAKSYCDKAINLTDRLSGRFANLRKELRFISGLISDFG